MQTLEAFWEKTLRYLFQLVCANCNYFKWNMQNMSQLQWVQVKRAQSDQMATIPTTMRRVWTSYSYSKPITRISTESCIVWANWIYFYWNEHSLSQSQLFKLESAYSEPIANISTITCINWGNCIYFKPIMHILYANCNYFDWSTHGLSQLQRFQVKCA